MRSVLFVILWAVSLSSLVHAETRDVLGYGRLITNDSMSTFNDRWQTGSVSSSRVRGFDWTGVAPANPFDLLEFRFGGQVITPGNLRSPSRGDRPFAGVLSFGVHTHFNEGPMEYALGTDFVFVGPQTRLFDFQTGLHDVLGFAPASARVRDAQLGDDVHLGFVSEMARTYEFGQAAAIRPFSELRWGPEDIIRFGADLTVGTVGQEELLARDPVTGQRYRVVLNKQPGFSYVLGGDIALVDDSVYLPATSGVVASDQRSRLRAGVHWQGEKSAVFYGLTWLSKEFEAQPESQVLGSIRLNLKF